MELEKRAGAGVKAVLKLGNGKSKVGARKFHASHQRLTTLVATTTSIPTHFSTFIDGGCAASSGAFAAGRQSTGKTRAPICTPKHALTFFWAVVRGKRWSVQPSHEQVLDMAFIHSTKTGVLAPLAQLA